MGKRLLSFYQKLSMRCQMTDSQQVNTHLLVYTKVYALEQLERLLRHSISNYFKFIEALASQDAKTHAGSGKYKKLVLFQHRVNQIQYYDEQKQGDVTDAIVRDKSAPIDSLLKTILLANSMIIGSFGQTGIIKHKIRIPSRQKFIMCVLKFASKSYFTDPCLLDNSRLQREIVNDAIGAAIQDLFPFEELVSPIVNGQQSFHPSDADKIFAKRMVDQSKDFSVADVERAVENMETDNTHPLRNQMSDSMTDSMFTNMPQAMRPGGNQFRHVDQPTIYQPHPSLTSLGSGSGAAGEEMYDEYFMDREDGGDDEEFESHEDESEERDNSDEITDEEMVEDEKRKQSVKIPKSKRHQTHKRKRCVDNMGFVDSE